MQILSIDFSTTGGQDSGLTFHRLRDIMEKIANYVYKKGRQV